MQSSEHESPRSREARHGRGLGCHGRRAARRGIRLAPLHGNPPPEVRQNPPAGPREDCHRCHACGHRIGAGGFGLPPLLFCYVGLRGIFPARPEQSPFAKSKTVRPLSGRLVRNGPILQCYKFVTFLFPGFGGGPRLWRRNVQIFSPRARTYVLIRLEKYKILQKPVLLWVSPFFAYNGPLLPDFGVFRRSPPFV